MPSSVSGGGIIALGDLEDGDDSLVRATRYCVGQSAYFRATRSPMILDLDSEDEEYDGAGGLAAILPARAESAAGDRRLLYLAWLLCVQNRRGRARR